MPVRCPPHADEVGAADVLAPLVAVLAGVHVLDGLVGDVGLRTEDPHTGGAQ